MAMVGSQRDGSTLIADAKVKDPLSATPKQIGARGAKVAFGNTLPGVREQVLGRPQRGQKGDGQFDELTGRGYVQALRGDYRDALALNHRVVPLLFETFGGFGPDVVKLIYEFSERVNNKLNSEQYAHTTWSARSWRSFQTQRISIALQKAVAHQIGTELQLAVVEDPRVPRRRG